MTRNIWIGIVVVILLVAGGWWYLNQSSAPVVSETTQLPTLQETKKAGNQPITPAQTTPTPAAQQPTQTPGSIALKKYRNEKFGFEIEYSPEYTITAAPSSPTTTFVEVFFDKPNFRLKFFAGTRETGGYLEGHRGILWTKKITVSGQTQDESLVKCDDTGKEVALSVGAMYSMEKMRFDKFASDCFDQSLEASVVPQMEAIIKTLKYDNTSNTSSDTLFSHPTDGYSFTYDASKLEARVTSATEFPSGTGLLPSSAIFSGGGYEQAGEILTYRGSIDAAQEAFVGAYRYYYSPQVLGTENLTINGNQARIVTYKVGPSYPEAKVYLIAYRPNEPRTIVTTGDYDVVATIKSR